ncbi:hypothetical protein GAU_2115 [Gemmatimonas aurantiaca T-27]|uniref:Uncharacterized protein n=1 Tax=Gemmatimonas aurantiaca (strain DSM 14586 / JCM 11422 / NBRC 100505 / T-27) TaxID=379066 RepID=C1A9I0_GEMAT|nr:hypothetical protein GAU_2115 [Gemmatimonas aurantiaca T-27]
MLLASALLAGCLGDNGSVSVKGDVAGLDSLALRGDSLIARAGRSAPTSLDSVRAAVEAQLASGASGVTPGGAVGGLTTGAGDGVLVTTPAAAPREMPRTSSLGAEMSRRAQALGDSMARAAAARLVGGTGASRSRSDSLRGVLAFQGNEPARQVVLKTAEATVALSGMATNGMSRLVGKEVVVHGVKVTPRDIVVANYVVRAADGVPAIDGVLDAEGGLRMTDGSGTRRVSVPSTLRPYVGARVWIALRDGVAVNYGVIGSR